MTGIKELPKKYRRQVLFDSAQKIYAELGYQFGIDVTDYQSTDKEAARVRSSGLAWLSLDSPT